MIENSQMWWYWPQVPWELEGVFRGTFDNYPDEYEALWNDFENITQDGENVTRDDINANIDALWGAIWEIPEGFLRGDDPVKLRLYDTGYPDLVSKDDPEPDGYDQIALQVYGYSVWQWYRLDLAMQASKLTQFGRRGRRT